MTNIIAADFISDIDKSGEWVYYVISWNGRCVTAGVHGRDEGDGRGVDGAAAR